MSDNDVSILKLVNDSGYGADIGFYRNIDLGADSRLEQLEKHGFIKKHDKSNNDYAGDYEITGKGYAFLSDYESGIEKSQSAKKKELISNIYIPLIVSVITNVVISLIKP